MRTSFTLCVTVLAGLFGTPALAIEQVLANQAANTIYVGDYLDWQLDHFVNRGVYALKNGSLQAVGLTNSETLEIIGGSGDDHLELINSTEGNLYLGFDADYLIPIESVTPGIIRVYGQGGNDVIFGSDFADRLQGGAGNDEIHGRQGGDIIYGGLGDDVLHGNEGNDQISGFEDTIVGGETGDNGCFEHAAGCGSDNACDLCFGESGSDQIGCDASVDGGLGADDICWEDFYGTPAGCETEALPFQCD